MTSRSGHCFIDDASTGRIHACYLGPLGEPTGTRWRVHHHGAETQEQADSELERVLLEEHVPQEPDTEDRGRFAWDGDGGRSGLFDFIDRLTEVER